MLATDAQLVSQVKAGDHAAFNQLYERYAAAIFRYIYFRVGQTELAEDIHADVFLRMFEGIERYEERGWPISAWLYRIAHDRIIDFIRRTRKRHIVSLEAWDGCCDGPEHTVGMRMENEELQQTLADLTVEQREVITLRFIADLSIQEVAARLGRSEGSVKSLQYRGIQSLARRLHAA